MSRSYATTNYPDPRSSGNLPADPGEKLRKLPDPDFPGSSGKFAGGSGWNAAEYSGSGSFSRIIRKFLGRIRMKSSGFFRIRINRGNLLNR